MVRWTVSCLHEIIMTFGRTDHAIIREPHLTTPEPIALPTGPSEGCTGTSQSECHNENTMMGGPQWPQTDTP